MTIRCNRILSCAFLSLVAVVLLPVLSAGAEGKSRFAIVASKDFPVDELSRGDLKRLYMGQPVYLGGRTLVPIALSKTQPDRAEFDLSVTGMDAANTALYWIDRKIRGQSGEPKSVESPDVLLRVVSQVPGSVGYVAASVVKGSVKVLRIDGKRPGDPDYRIGR